MYVLLGASVNAILVGSAFFSRIILEQRLNILAIDRFLPLQKHQILNGDREFRDRIISPSLFL